MGATHLLEDGYNIRTVQELLAHKDLHTTMVYRRVMNRGVEECGPFNSLVCKPGKRPARRQVSFLRLRDDARRLRVEDLGAAALAERCCFGLGRFRTISSTTERSSGGSFSMYSGLPEIA